MLSLDVDDYLDVLDEKNMMIIINIIEYKDNTNKILKYNKKIYDLNYQYLIGYIYFLNKNFNEAINIFNNLKKQNNHYAINFLGYMHATGIGVIKDYSEAFKLYEKAAELGSSQAICNLARIYENLHIGISLPKSIYTDNVIKAYYDSNGNIHKINIKKIIELYKKSIDLENSSAMNILAMKYVCGSCVKRNMSKAVYLLTRAAELGNGLAINNLAFIYHGDLYSDVVQSYERAIELYNIAIELNNSIRCSFSECIVENNFYNIPRGTSINSMYIAKNNLENLYFKSCTNFNNCNIINVIKLINKSINLKVTYSDDFLKKTCRNYFNIITVNIINNNIKISEQYNYINKCENVPLSNSYIKAFDNFKSYKKFDFI